MSVTTANKQQEFIEWGKKAVLSELKAIEDLSQRVDQDFAQACQHLFNCKGRIIVLGMGKSGHIARKIAATLASTGSPAFFVHPGEANHGDLGMITGDDVVIACSNSGETQEISNLLPQIKRLKVPLISLCGKTDSTLAQAANVNLDVSVEQEACPLGLAPTASTTVTLVMGDALAVALLSARGFTAQDFALSHPGGALGRRLLLRVDDIMRRNEHIPKVSIHAQLTEALLVMSQKGMGMVAVVDDNDTVVGVFTDGDLRRTLEKLQNIHNIAVIDVMTKNCKSVSPQVLAAEALNIMEETKISALVVVNQYNQLIGALHMHDMLQAGVI